MSLSPAPRPAIATPPTDPCLECFRLGAHEVPNRGPGTHTCDPIMAAMGMWAQRKAAQRAAELEELKARARQLKKKTA